MRSLLRVSLLGLVLLFSFQLAQAQNPVNDVQPGSYPSAGITPDMQGQPPAKVPQRNLEDEVEHLKQQIDAIGGRQGGTTTEEKLILVQHELQTMLNQVTAQGAVAQDEQLKKQLEIQRGQIETLEKMVKLLADQVKKQPPPSAEMEKLQIQVARLAARENQSAQRDMELAQAVDNINEHQDADERNGPQLPTYLKELFLPSGNCETPLTIAGALAVGYNHLEHTPSGFYFGEFSPDFFVKLNDWILLEAEIAAGGDGSVGLSFGQADFLINDWLTVIAGYFVAPIGFYNDRLNNPWINKLPGDAPAGASALPWLQVLPPIALMGVQARGAFYLGCSPIKMEYAAYVSNGLNTSAVPGTATINDIANTVEDFVGNGTLTSVSNEKAFGGRVGFWYPECGLEAGLSGMTSGDYIPGFEDAFSLWVADFNYHKGNWDVRAEYGMSFQDAKAFAGTPGLTANTIQRQGFWAQAAYRPRDCSNRYLQNTEVVYRYSYVNFHGIDPTALDPTAFASPVDVPVKRQQNEMGINYYFYPRMVLKCAYQINDEPGFHLHDNQFIAELAWGW